MFNLETRCWIFPFFFFFSLGRSVVSCTPFASCGHLHAVMFTVAKVFCTAMFIKIPPFLAWRQHGESALRRPPRQSVDVCCCFVYPCFFLFFSSFFSISPSEQISAGPSWGGITGCWFERLPGRGAGNLRLFFRCVVQVAVQRREDGEFG